MYFRIVALQHYSNNDKGIVCNPLRIALLKQYVRCVKEKFPRRIFSTRDIIVRTYRKEDAVYLTKVKPNISKNNKESIKTFRFGVEIALYPKVNLAGK